jgi:hypothetical protein
LLVACMSVGAQRRTRTAHCPSLRRMNVLRMA